MRRARTLAATLMVAALLSVSAVSAATAQEDAEPMAPPPGEPFAAVLSGSVSFEPLEAPTEECQAPVMTITDATGSSTIGEITLHAEHCPTAGLPTVPLGVQTIATAGGGELSSVYFVDCLPVGASAPEGEPITCEGRLVFTGGTGRFAEATGSATEVAFVWFPGSFEIQGWPWVAKLEGSISY